MHAPAAERNVERAANYLALARELDRTAADQWQIEALRWTLADGRRSEMRLPPDAVHTFHRPHSGAEFFAEVRVPLPTDRIEEFTVVYTCPPHELEERFHQAMIDVYERARREAGYHAARFLGMVSEVGGVEAAHRLLKAPDPSDGFVALWEKGRLDLSVEAQVLRSEFRELFSADELARAMSRLASVGYVSDPS